MKPLFRNLITLGAIAAVISAAAVLSPRTKSLVEAAAESTSPRSMPLSEKWMVTKVSDGDTITVRQTDGQEMKVRFCGIDAPEKSQPLGPKSKANLQKLIDEAQGEVQVSVIEKDRYGRFVAEVFTVLGDKERSLNEEQLSSGMAYLYRQYSKNCPNATVFEQAEAIAQQKRLGVWAGNYQRPWDYRKNK